MENYNKIESHINESEEKRVEHLNGKRGTLSQQSENDNLIIEDNTIYEIDLDCYECLMRERKRLGRS